MNDKKAAAYDGIAYEIGRLKREIGVLHDLVAHHAAQAQSTQTEIETVRRRIEMLREISDNHMAKKSGGKSAEIEVTDHAVLRYVERVLGINVDAIKEKIASDAVCRCAQSLGDGRYPIEPDVKAVVKGGKIVTVIKYGDGLC